MKPLTIEELIPARAEFKLAATGDTVHTLRPVSLDDRIWLDKNIGDPEERARIFNEFKLDPILRIVFHQLEDKTPFAPIDVEDMDPDTGEKTKLRLTPIARMRRSVHSSQEMLVVVKALLKTIGISEPIYDKLEEEEKKKAKRATKNPTGEKSSISSPQSTATP